MEVGFEPSAEPGTLNSLLKLILLVTDFDIKCVGPITHQSREPAFLSQ